MIRPRPRDYFENYMVVQVGEIPHDAPVSQRNVQNMTCHVMETAQSIAYIEHISGVTWRAKSEGSREMHYQEFGTIRTWIPWHYLRPVSDEKARAYIARLTAQTAEEFFAINAEEG